MTTPVAPVLGRPRDEARRQAILECTYTLLSEQGLDAVTTPAIAAAAGASTATLYRWWPSKEALVMDAYLATVSARVRKLPSETTDVLVSLRAQLRSTARALAGVEGGVLAALITCAQRSPDVHSVFMERFLEPRRAELRQLIERGMDDGSLRADLYPERLLDALYAPLYYGLLVSHRPLTRRAVDAHLELVLRGAAHSMTDSLRARAGR